MGGSASSGSPCRSVRARGAANPAVLRAGGSVQVFPSISLSEPEFATLTSPTVRLAAFLSLDSCSRCSTTGNTKVTLRRPLTRPSPIPPTLLPRFLNLPTIPGSLHASRAPAPTLLLAGERGALALCNQRRNELTKRRQGGPRVAVHKVALTRAARRKCPKPDRRATTLTSKRSNC